MNILSYSLRAAGCLVALASFTAPAAVFAASSSLPNPDRAAPGVTLNNKLVLGGRSVTHRAVEDAVGPPYAVTTREIPVKIGDRRVEIVVHQSARPGPTYINVHDDENTAVASALARLRCCGGRLIELRHGGSRYISFRLRGVKYKFDPNRIFTDRGARATLKWLGSYSPAAWVATRRFAKRIIAVAGINSLAYVVAVHNNTRGHYSADSYIKGAGEARDAAAVYIPHGSDPDDFFFVTSHAVYTELRALGRFPIVLQNNAHATDDGSLSIYAAKHGIICFTVEAQEGHLQRQAEMYGYLLDGFAVVRQEDQAAIARWVVPPRQRGTNNGRIVTGLGVAPQIASENPSAWSDLGRLRRAITGETAFESDTNRRK